MPDMREGGWGTAACYLTVERLALQAGVESPFWDGASLLMGGCEEAVAERITRTWDGDAPGRIYGLAHAAYHDHIPENFASSDDLDEP